MEQRYDDEINLRDYINVLIKRKLTILVVFFICVVIAIIYSFTAPKIYKVHQIIKVPTVGMNKYLDSPIKVKERIEEGVYDQKIKNALGLDKEGQFNFDFIVPEENIFIRVSLKTIEDKVNQSKAILEELLNQLESDYAADISVKVTEIDNDILLKKNQIERKTDKIKTLIAKIKLTDERIISLEKELARVNANVEKLRSAQRDFIKPSQNKDNMAAVLYTITIQQAIRYSNQLEDQLNSLRTNKKEKENSIQDLKNTIEDIKIQIKDLQNNKRFIQNIKLLQPPIKSEAASKKKQNVVIGGIIGLLLGALIALIKDALKEAKKNS